MHRSLSKHSKSLPKALQSAEAIRHLNEVTKWWNKAYSTEATIHSAKWMINNQESWLKVTGKVEWWAIQLNEIWLGWMTWWFGRMGVEDQIFMLKHVGSLEWTSVQSNEVTFGRILSPFIRKKIADCTIFFLCKPYFVGYFRAYFSLFF